MRLETLLLPNQTRPIVGAQASRPPYLEPRRPTTPSARRRRAPERTGGLSPARHGAERHAHEERRGGDDLELAYRCLRRELQA
jgi:hypothetical protein